MKNVFAVSLTLILTLSTLAGCGQNGSDFNADSLISVVSREDGSGTRGAFVELFGIQATSDDGSKKDMTSKEAIIADKTDIVMTNIANDPYAIGYISLGSVNGTVKALDIDGVKATPENVKNGTYKIQRPFNIATKGEPAGLAKDFVGFILSGEGQDIVTANNYIAVEENPPAYAGDKPSGKLVVSGSSSVAPVMEKLKEAYNIVNPGATIEIQMSDSTSGMTAAMNGTCDIGMASRELKDSEKAELSDIAIALDGIVVIVNNKNTVTGVSGEQVKSIFTGESEQWSAVE